MNKVEQVEEDILSKIGEDEHEEDVQNLVGFSISQKTEEKSPKLPSRKLIKKLIDDQFSYDRKRLIFLSANSATLAVTFFNLFSSINIEGHDSLISYEETASIKVGTQSIYYLIFCMILVHLIKIFSCVVGYFAVNQKSERMITIYLILSMAALVLRGIVTLLLIISQGMIQTVCLEIFGTDAGPYMAYQYVIVLSAFGIIEILLSLVSLVQASQSREEYIAFRKYHDRLLKKQTVCYEAALHTFF